MKPTTSGGSAVRVLEDLRLHVRGRSGGIPRHGDYDALIDKSNIVFVRREALRPMSPLDESADSEALLRQHPKNFAVPVEEILSARLRRGIPWTTDSKIVLDLRDARLVLGLKESSVDPGRFAEAQRALQLLRIGRVEGLPGGPERVRPSPPGANAIALLGAVGSVLNLIRGASWVALGGPAFVPGASLIASAAWMLVLTRGLVRGERWAWRMSLASFPLWVLWGSALSLQGYPSAWAGVAWYPLMLGYLVSPGTRRFFAEGVAVRPVPDWVGLFAVRHPVAGRLLAGLGMPFGLYPAGDLARASARLGLFGIDAEFYHRKGADIRSLDDAFFLLHSADAARPSSVKNFEALVDSLRAGDFDAHYRALEAADLVRAGRTVEIGGRLEEVQGDLVVDRNAANGTTQLWRLKMLPAPDGASTAVRLLDAAVLRNQLRETATPLGGRLPAGVQSVLRMDARLVPVESGTAVEQMREVALGVKSAFGIHELLVRTSVGDLLA